VILWLMAADPGQKTRSCPGRLFVIGMSAAILQAGGRGSAIT